MPKVTLKHVNSLISSEQQQNLKVRLADIDMIFAGAVKTCLKAVHVTKHAMFTKPECENSKPYNTNPASQLTSVFQISDTTSQKASICLDFKLAHASVISLKC